MYGTPIAIKRTLGLLLLALGNVQVSLVILMEREVSINQAFFCTAAQRDFIQKFLQSYKSLNSLLAISVHSLALSQILVQEIDLSKNKNVLKGEVSDYLNSFRTSHSCISLYTNGIHYSGVKIFVARNNRLASRRRHPRHLSQWNWDVCYHQFS